jgi:hypothetical protein
MFRIMRTLALSSAIVLGTLFALPGVASADEHRVESHERGARERFERERIERERMERERLERERVARERERRERIERERAEHARTCAIAFHERVPEWRLREMGCFVR